MKISYKDMLQTPATVIFGDLEYIGIENTMKNKQASK